jgi:tellurite resistance protein TerC
MGGLKGRWLAVFSPAEPVQATLSQILKVFQFVGSGGCPHNRAFPSRGVTNLPPGASRGFGGWGFRQYVVCFSAKQTAGNPGPGAMPGSGQTLEGVCSSTPSFKVSFMESIAPLWLWGVFVAFVLVALFVDFVVLSKQGAHEVGVKEALYWSLAWVAVSLVFNAMFWWAIKDTTGSVEVANEKALEFLTGYLIEKSLAVDNIFVFLLIFTYFAVPPTFQKRVLMIGILGAIVLRTIMILVGAWLLDQFHWILYVFGAFLILTGIKMWRGADSESNLDDNPALKLLRRIMPVSKEYDGEKFFTIENGKRIATPLLMVIALVGMTDVIFAVDSIPAIFAITKDPFIVLTSNVFAILGLRAMFFLLQAAASRFHLLNYGLAVILVFIGTKMMLIDIFKIPVAVSLGVVMGVLVITMIWSSKTAPNT